VTRKGGPSGGMDAALSAARAEHRAGNVAAAKRRYAEVLQKHPDHPEALHGLAVLALHSRDNAAAAGLLARLVRVRPGDARAHNLLGLAESRLGRAAEAEAAFRRAVALDPGLAEALANLGGALHDRGALAEAEAALEKATALAPGLVFALNSLGMVRRDRGRHAEAADAYRKALAATPEEATIWRNLGNALQESGDLAGAADAFTRTLALRPDEGRALTLLIHAEQRRGRWDAVVPLEARVHQAIRDGVAGLDPMVLVALDTTPQERLAAARHLCAAEFPGLGPMPPLPPAGRAGPVVVGYLSPDFRDHPVGRLIAPLLEAHDRSAVKVIGYALNPADGTPLRARLERACDWFVDLSPTPVPEAAARIRADGVDVLVDLAGHTQSARRGVLALRPARVQAAYLGFAGTTGAAYIDYLVADAFVAPPEAAGDFSEALVRLPGCFMVGEPAREIGPTPARAACGLPERGFVFCAFNRPEKLRPAMFDTWMGILAAVPDSVLWLTARGEAAENLKAEAGRRGVDPGRLVFAGRVPEARDHLARLALAGLFLDTSPYNAHATAIDALRAGVPVLTCPGEGFAARVGGSLLMSLGLTELIAPDPGAYARTAVHLATHPDALAALGARLAMARGPGTPFDVGSHARALEAAFREMRDRHAAGAAPRAIEVPAAP
jgi:predicted O-linked N-acetylglucosamine transferase (SPINDLY family)